MDLTDPVASYCFDQAVAHIGRAIENELEKAGQDCKTEAEAQAKKETVLNRFLDDGDEAAPIPKGRFADPATMMI